MRSMLSCRARKGSLASRSSLKRAFGAMSHGPHSSSSDRGGGMAMRSGQEGPMNENRLAEMIRAESERSWDIHGRRKSDRLNTDLHSDDGRNVIDPLGDFLRSAHKRAQKSQDPHTSMASEEDLKATMQEWYLRKIQQNKWNHFINEMISTRLSRPNNWKLDDPLPDWPTSHMTASDPSDALMTLASQASSSRAVPNGEIMRLSGSGGSEGGTAPGGVFDDFELEYTRQLSDEFNLDNMPPYLPGQLRALKEGGQFGWQNRAARLKEFFEDQNTAMQYHLDSTELPWVPDFYYDPHPPLPAYRNHEALTSIDPRRPTSVPEGDNLETEKALMLKHGLKPWKRQQNVEGVAYTPDFDFDLWSEDMHRPHNPTNTYGFTPIKRRVTPLISRKQLPQRKRMQLKQYAPSHEPLIEFRWFSTVSHNKFHPSKKPRYTVLKIMGNGRGCAGIGFGTGTSYLEATRKADQIAAHNMIYVPRYMNHTISHSLTGKHYRMRIRIDPKPFGFGERGPPIIKAICHAFGIRDFGARMISKQKNMSKYTKIYAIWKCFLRATNPQIDCQDRGQRMVEAFPEVDGYSYQLPRGFSHDARQEALQILKEHQNHYEAEERFSKYDLSSNERRSLPVWITDRPNAFWEGGMPDIRGYQYRPDLLDILNQKGPGGIDRESEARIQKLLAEKIDPCDHHFRWLKAMIKVGPDQALGF